MLNRYTGKMSMSWKEGEKKLAQWKHRELGGELKSTKIYTKKRQKVANRLLNGTRGEQHTISRKKQRSKITIKNYKLLVR